MKALLIIAGMLTGWILSGYNAQIGPKVPSSWIVSMVDHQKDDP